MATDLSQALDFKPKFRIVWTLEMDGTLLALINRGLSYSEVGRRMGKSKNSCVSRARRLGVRMIIPHPRPRPVQEFPPPGHCFYSPSKTGPFIFCGKPALPDRAWCEEHAPLLSFKAP